MIQLIRLPLFKSHSLPYPLFPAIEMLEILLLEDESNEREGANGDENFVAAVIVRSVVCAVNFCVDGLVSVVGEGEQLLVDS